MDNDFTSDTTSALLAVETRYLLAFANLERAQAERTEAVCHFLEAKSEWIEANPHLSHHDSPYPVEPNDPLLQAEKELLKSKGAYCTALEHHQYSLRVLAQAREVFKRAQENLDQLAIAYSHCPCPQPSNSIK